MFKKINDQHEIYSENRRMCKGNRLYACVLRRARYKS